MKRGYKESKLGLIPNDWEVKKLGEITNGKGIYGINAAAVAFKENLPTYLRITDINEEGYFSSEKLSSVDDENSKDFYLKAGDLVFVRTGSTTGKTYLYNESDGLLVYAGFLIKFSINSKKANDYYVWNYTKTNEYSIWVQKFSQRSGQPGLNSNECYNLLLPLPPLPEQKAIADCLSTWDKATALQNKLIVDKQYRKDALIQQLLNGKQRMPGFTDKWKEYSFSQLIKPITRKEVWDDTKMYKLISVRRRSGGIFARQSLYGHQIEVKQLVKVKENDFLISKMQIVHGASSIVKKEFEDYYVSGSYVILNIKDEKILTPFYLDYVSKQKLFYHQTYIASYGVHIEKMTFDFKSFLKMKVTLPSILEQEKITKIIDTAEKEIQLEKQKIADLQEQKKGLMQQLLKGKVRLV